MFKPSHERLFICLHEGFSSGPIFKPFLKTKYNLIKINTAYCDKLLRNTPRSLIWNNIDYILYNTIVENILQYYCREYNQYYSISDCVVCFLKTYHNRLY